MEDIRIVQDVGQVGILEETTLLTLHPSGSRQLSSVNKS